MDVDDALGGLARLSTSCARWLTCSKALRDSTKAAGTVNVLSDVSRKVDTHLWVAEAQLV